MNINFYMQQAILEANKASSYKEVPIGAVIIDNLSESIIAKTHNQTFLKKNATQHAEIIAIEKACKKLNSKYLNNTSIFITLEPCAMCLGAMIHARIDKVVFGAFDIKYRASKSIQELQFQKKYNHRLVIVEGVLERKCKKLLQSFFQNRRK